MLFTQQKESTTSGTSTRADEMAKTAAARLLGTPYSALQFVSCAYQHGVLTLRGSLPSYYLKQVAQEAVTGLDGVLSIDNQIEVRAETVIDR